MLKNYINLSHKIIRKRRRNFFQTYYFSVFITVLGITLFLIPVVSKVFSSFNLQLYLRNYKQNEKLIDGLNLITTLPTDSALRNEEIFDDYPVRLVIPSVKVDVSIKPARIIGGVWEIHEDSANFGLGSALPGRIGNSVIFAHDRINLFSPLKKVALHDLIAVKTHNNQWYPYIVTEKKEVNPDQTEIIAPTFDKTLTLFTCSGIADSKRFIVIAKSL